MLRLAVLLAIVSLETNVSAQETNDNAKEWCAGWYCETTTYYFPSYEIAETVLKTWVIVVTVIGVLSVVVVATVIICCVCPSCPIYKCMHKEIQTATRPNVVTHVYMDPNRPGSSYPQDPNHPQAQAQYIPGSVYQSAPPLPSGYYQQAPQVHTVPKGK